MICQFEHLTQPYSNPIDNKQKLGTEKGSTGREPKFENFTKNPPNVPQIFGLGKHSYYCSTNRKF